MTDAQADAREYAEAVRRLRANLKKYGQGRTRTRRKSPFITCCQALDVARRLGYRRVLPATRLPSYPEVCERLGGVPTE